MTEGNKPQHWLEYHNLKEWQDWLSNNHKLESHIWLKIKKAKAKKMGILLQEAVTEAIRYGWIDGKMYSLDENSYILRFSPRKPDSLWSEINRRRAEELIADGRMTIDGLAAIDEAKAKGRWQSAYTSRKPADMPDDLRAALQTDEIAAMNFQNWPNSSRMQAIAWIQESKKQSTRDRRIQKIVHVAHHGLKLV